MPASIANCLRLNSSASANTQRAGATRPIFVVDVRGCTRTPAFSAATDANDARANQSCIVVGTRGRGGSEGVESCRKPTRCPKNNNGFLWVTSEVIYSSQCAAGSNISGAWRKASSRCQEKAERHQTIFPQSCSHELALLLCASACCCSEGATRSRCIRGQGLLT